MTLEPQNIGQITDGAGVRSQLQDQAVTVAGRRARGSDSQESGPHDPRPDSRESEPGATATPGSQARAGVLAGCRCAAGVRVPRRGRWHGQRRDGGILAALDGAPLGPYRDPILLPADETFRLHFQARDELGNVSAPMALRIRP